ncbi:MAG TPA: hypothetical protein VF820_04110 [Patescibacteria group bacterium]
MQAVIKKLEKIPTVGIVFFYILLGFILYAGSLFSAFMADDLEQIVRNPLVQTLSNIPKDFLATSTFNTGGGLSHGLYYKPVLLLFFTIFYNLGGNGSWFLHVVQVAIHIANAIFVFILLKKFFPKLGALLGSFLFLIHPVNIETVVYISNLQDVLFFFFGMLSLIIFLSKKSYMWQGVAQVLLLCSLLSKETGILFFAVIPLLLFFFASKKQTLQFFLGIIPTIILYAALRFGVAGIPIVNKSNFPLTSVPLGMRLLYIPYLIQYYLKAFFWPSDLFVFQLWGIKTLTFTTFYGPLLVDSIFVILAALIGVFLKYKKSPCTLAFVFFAIWFTLGMLLHLQIVPLDATAAGRWFYFPEVGIIGMLLCFFASVSVTKKGIKTAGLYVIAVILLILFIRSFIRVSQWSSALVLFQRDWKVGYNTYTGDTKEFTYFSPMESLLAVELLNNGFIEEAKQHFLHAAMVSTDSYTKAVALNNLAVTYEKLGDYTNAQKTYQEELHISNFYIGYNNYADFLTRHADVKEAQTFIVKSLQLFPDNAQLWYDLSVVENALGNTTEAHNALQKALALDSTIVSQNQSMQLPSNVPLYNKKQ